MRGRLCSSRAPGTTDTHANRVYGRPLNLWRRDRSNVSRLLDRSHFAVDFYRAFGFGKKPEHVLVIVESLHRMRQQLS